MCGIAGILSIAPQKSDVTDIEKMTAAMAHRGPDGRYTYCNEEATVTLGHCRLAIIDPQPSSAQPMHYSDRYSIVHNGEIYNYLELRQTLVDKGYKFRTNSDTEVILAAYDYFKDECVQQFDGMFAFAIWDEREKILFGARDRFGEKPFYYSYDDNSKRFCFASEIKALWAAGVPRSIDENRLLSYLSLGYTTHPRDLSRSFYKQVKKLEPAHFLKLDMNSGTPQLRTGRYWNLDKSAMLTIKEEEAIRRFQGLFSTSVRLRLRSDVAIGTSLSGGIDSSSVVATIHQVNERNSHYVQKAFTAAFPGFVKDESADAARVASTFDLQHFLSFPDSNQLGSDIEKLVQLHEEPISSASVYVQYKVFELAAQHGIKVLLDGQGADEILAGYPKYLQWFLQELLRNGEFASFAKEKASLQRTGAGLKWGTANYLAAAMPGLAAQQLHHKTFSLLSSDEAIHPAFRNEFSRETDVYKPTVRALNDLLYYNTSDFGLEELLRYADKNSMAHGCEVRLPFLQHELVQFIFSLPSAMKINSGYTKWILRRAMEGKVPAQIVWKARKTGFEPPQHAWMENAGIQSLIHFGKEKLVKYGALNKSVLTKKIQPHNAYAAENNDWRYLTAGLLV